MMRSRGLSTPLPFQHREAKQMSDAVTSHTILAIFYFWCGVATIAVGISRDDQLTAVVGALLCVICILSVLEW